MIEGNKVSLVPYTVDHVKTYNKWLNDPYIQNMTSTEPYSLEQEYEYQKEWIDDETKYIFIILDKTRDNAMAGDIVKSPFIKSLYFFCCIYVFTIFYYFGCLQQQTP